MQVKLIMHKKDLIFFFLKKAASKREKIITFYCVVSTLVCTVSHCVTQSGRKSIKPTDFIASETKYGTELHHTEQSRLVNKTFASFNSNYRVILLVRSHSDYFNVVWPLFQAFIANLRLWHNMTIIIKRRVISVVLTI